MTYAITIHLLADKLAPPTGLKSGKVESTSVELQWDAVTGATDYSVYQDGSMVKKSSSNMAKIDTLTKGTTYKFAVSVNNAAGEGQKSSDISVTTSSFGMLFHFFSVIP